MKNCIIHGSNNTFGYLADFRLFRLAAILYFTNKAATEGTRLGVLHKSNVYDTGKIWAKVGAFEEFEPTYPWLYQCVRTSFFFGLNILV